MTGGAKTGYNISLSQESVTLSPTNAQASVILTNDIIKGSRAASRLTDPSSGFAGDTSALAEAQALANSESLTGRRTGDETPISRFVAIAIASGAVIVILVIIALLRRRKRKK